MVVCHWLSLSVSPVPGCLGPKVAGIGSSLSNGTKQGAMNECILVTERLSLVFSRFHWVVFVEASPS